MIMGVVPAKVAGVGQIVVTSPADAEGGLRLAWAAQIAWR